MLVSLLSLLLPIVLSAVAVFFASFLSWMVVQLHKQDWRKLPHEEAFLRSVGELNVPPGNYMFPCASSPEEMKSEAYQKQWAHGPKGVVTFFSGMYMGRNLALTMLYFLAVNFCLAYLASLAMGPGADFMKVFRFVSTAGLMTYFAAIVPHSIWYHCRITGHLIESLVFASLSGAIFAALWPK